MGFRFRKSVTIFGMRFNFGKKGLTSASVGGRALRVNVSSRGTRLTVSLPGTGLSHSTRVSAKGTNSGVAAPEAVRAATPLSRAKTIEDFEPHHQLTLWYLATPHPLRPKPSPPFWRRWFLSRSAHGLRGDEAGIHTLVDRLRATAATCPILSPPIIEARESIVPAAVEIALGYSRHAAYPWTWLPQFASETRDLHVPVVAVRLIGEAFSSCPAAQAVLLTGYDNDCTERFASDLVDFSVLIRRDEWDEVCWPHRSPPALCLQPFFPRQRLRLAGASRGAPVEFKLTDLA